MNKYLSRVTSSARGEAFNPLIWPFLFITLAYGIGCFTTTDGGSSMLAAMISLNPMVPVIWGSIALITIACGLTFLLFNIPPFGKISGLVGFMLWLFGAWCYYFTGSWVPLFAVALPNVWFWFWQYLSLGLFRREDAEDKATMKAYNAGGYDNQERPRAARIDRENNRGVDEQ